MRHPSRTVRIDPQTHAALRDLTIRYRLAWRRHVSIADIVRMGVTLLNADIDRRGGKPPEEEQSHAERAG